MQPLTDELAEILKSKFQAAARGFRAKIEIVTIEEPCTSPILVTVDESYSDDQVICKYISGSVTVGINGDTPSADNLVEVDPSAGTISITASVGEGDVVYIYFDPDTSDSSSTIQLNGPMHIAIDKSMRMPADEATVDLVNEGLPLGWGTTSVAKTNSRIRIWQWYGDEANAVLTFTGVIDDVHDFRNPLTTSLRCRDMMALLIDQNFSTTAPQGAAEDGAVRTPANGVYLNYGVSDIVSDILDRAGWPAADRAITQASYVLEEFIIDDGSSWADAIMGQERLTGITGFDLWADELGVIYFAPEQATDVATAPPPPVYTFRSGQDLTDLGDETDQYDLRTRVKVRGPFTTIKTAWIEVWRTTKIGHPVGMWYDPAQVAYLRVLDSSTKRLYLVRQADRVVISSVYVGGVCPHPRGLSGDPSDDTIYWLLDSPGYLGLSGTNRVLKVRRSDNVVLDTFSLPSGSWTDMKVSGAFIWLTNYTTDRFYSRDKSDGSAVADYSQSYPASAPVVQLNPSGIMVDGTTLYVFWRNGGSTARFLTADESDPSTVTGFTSTAGATFTGGDVDTTTHVDAYINDGYTGVVGKFTLAEPTSTTVELEVIDRDLEDELGLLAASQPRSHDAHPSAPPHAWEARRETIDLKVITSMAQAQVTANIWLHKLARRRRVRDAGIPGNPALQKRDIIRNEDPVTGVAEQSVVDTYRTTMDAEGVYVGTIASIPFTISSDVIVDDGEAT